MSGQQSRNTSKRNSSERKPRVGSRKNTSNYNDVVIVQGGGEGTYQMPMRAELMTISFHFGPVFPRHMGFMVGSKGSTLKEIMSQTGAKITTMPTDNMHSYPWFLVQGYYPQVQEAVGRLNEVRAIAEERIPYKHGQRQQQPRRPQPLLLPQQVEDATHDRPKSPNYSPESPNYSGKSSSFNHTFSSNGGMDADSNLSTFGVMPAENYSPTTPPPCREESAPAAPRKKIVKKKRTNDNE
mgnify:FL=1